MERVDTFWMTVILFVCWFNMWLMKRYANKHDMEVDNPKVIFSFIIHCILFNMTLIFIAPYIGYKKIY